MTIEMEGRADALIAAVACAGDPDLTDRDALADYLERQGWLRAGELIRECGPAGDSNMNLVLRVRTDRRSIVVKQGQPWVERFPQIPAPANRTGVEHEWYTLVGGVADLAAAVPTVLGYDPVERVLCLSDLGTGGELSWVYADTALTEQQAGALVDWLGRLHATFADDDRARRLVNRQMRVLNHEHIWTSRGPARCSTPLASWSPDGPSDDRHPGVDRHRPRRGHRGAGRRRRPGGACRVALTGAARRRHLDDVRQR